MRRAPDFRMHPFNFAFLWGPLGDPDARCISLCVRPRVSAPRGAGRCVRERFPPSPETHACVHVRAGAAREALAARVNALEVHVNEEVMARMAGACARARAPAQPSHPLTRLRRRCGHGGLAATAEIATLRARVDTGAAAARLGQTHPRALDQYEAALRELPQGAAYLGVRERVLGTYPTISGPLASNPFETSAGSAFSPDAIAMSADSGVCCAAAAAAAPLPPCARVLAGAPGAVCW